MIETEQHDSESERIGDFEVATVVKGCFAHQELRQWDGDSFTVLMRDHKELRNDIRKGQASAIGNVLTCGLGLGYLLTLYRDHPPIKSVTVVELHQEIADLVFSRLDLGELKVELVVDDITDYVGTTTRRDFDFCYFDCWTQPNEDTLWNTVLPLRNFVGTMLDVPQERISCWGEDQMRDGLLLTLKRRLQFAAGGLAGDPAFAQAAQALVGGDKIPTIDELCEHGHGWDWSVPFFEAYRKGTIEGDRLARGLMHYAKHVGKQGFEERWDAEQRVNQG